MGEMAGQAFQAVEKALHTPMPFTAGGQTISDRLTAAKHSLAGSQLGKSICKATTEECIGPKKKHLDYLLHCTHEPNVSIPQMANMLIERTQNGNWCVVFKSLVTIHNLMCYGNERFTQYLASCNCDLNLGNFLDKASMNGYEMSTHVRRYGKYIGEKIFTYRLCAFDFCKVKRGREDGLMRTMAPDKLLKTLPILQGQVDSLLEFQVTAGELTNGIINSAFILLFRDLIRLFACYNDGIINLLEKYFDMNKKNCKEALDMYKKFLTRMDNVSEFLKVAESVGIDKGEIPDLAKAPNSLLEALEAHLHGMEGGTRSGGGSRVTSPTMGGGSFMSGGASFGGRGGAEEAKYLREEEERMNRMKSQHLERQASLGAGTNPFATDDLLGLSAPTPAAQPRHTPLDDLLALNANGGAHPPPQAAFNPFASHAPAQPPQHNFFAPQQGGGMYGAPNPYAAQPVTGYGADEGGDDPFTVNVGKMNFGGPPPRPPSAARMREPPPVPPPTHTPAKSPQPPAASTNPFLSGGDEGAAPAWSPFSLNQAAPTPPSAFAPIQSGLPEPPVDSDSSADNTPAGHTTTIAAEIGNPFAAFHQNTSALHSVDAPTTGAEVADFGGNPFPVAPPSPDPPSQPMPILNAPQNPDNLGFYQTTPFSAMDSSYTSTPQLPRHMGAGFEQGQPPDSGLDPLGDLLRPSSSAGAPAIPPPIAGGPKPAEKVIKGDLDSSLANLTANLNLNKGQGPSKPVQWTGGMGGGIPAPGQQQPRVVGPGMGGVGGGGGAQGWSPNFGAPAPAAAGGWAQQPQDPFGAL